MTFQNHLAPRASSFPTIHRPRQNDGRAAAEFEQECVQFFAQVVQIFGVPKSVGQIYGVLYASPEPLSFSNIVERLKISKGSASQGLQLLRSLGAICEADLKLRVLSDKRDSHFGGSKPEHSINLQSAALRLAPNAGDSARNARVAYEAELSLRKLVSGVLRERIAPMAATSTERLARLRVLAEQGAGNNFYLERAKQLNAWRRRLKAILPVLGALLGPKK